MKNATKSIFTFLLLCLFFRSMSQTNPPYVMKNFKYDKIIAFECKENTNGSVATNDKIYSRIVKNPKTLSPGQIDTLNAFLKGTLQTDKNLRPECTQAYLGIIYYMKNQIVASLSISEGCNVFLLYFRDLKSPNVWPNFRLGFSESERNRINILCSDLGIKYD